MESKEVYGMFWRNVLLSCKNMARHQSNKSSKQRTSKSHDEGSRRLDELSLPEPVSTALKQLKFAELAGLDEKELAIKRLRVAGERELSALEEVVVNLTKSWLNPNQGIYRLLDSATLNLNPNSASDLLRCTIGTDDIVAELTYTPPQKRWLRSSTSKLTIALSFNHSPLGEPLEISIGSPGDTRLYGITTPEKTANPAGSISGESPTPRSEIYKLCQAISRVTSTILTKAGQDNHSDIGVVLSQQFELDLANALASLTHLYLLPSYYQARRVEQLHKGEHEKIIACINSAQQQIDEVTERSINKIMDVTNDLEATLNITTIRNEVSARVQEIYTNAAAYADRTELEKLQKERQRLTIEIAKLSGKHLSLITQAEKNELFDSLKIPLAELLPSLKISAQNDKLFLIGRVQQALNDAPIVSLSPNEMIELLELLFNTANDEIEYVGRDQYQLDRRRTRALLSVFGDCVSRLTSEDLPQFKEQLILITKNSSTKDLRKVVASILPTQNE